MISLLVLVSVLVYLGQSLPVQEWTDGNHFFIDEKSLRYPCDIVTSPNGDINIFVNSEPRILIQDEASTSLLLGLSAAGTCLVAPKEQTLGDECHKIGHLDFAAVTGALTQCDGKIIMPLESVPCVNNDNKNVEQNKTKTENVAKRHKRGLWDWIRTKSAEIGSVIEQAAGNAGDKIASAATVVHTETKGALAKVNDFGQKVQDTITNSTLGQEIGRIGGTISGGVQIGLDTVRKELESTGQQIVDGASTVGSAIKDGISTAYQDTKSFGQTAVKELSSRAKTIGDRIEKAVGPSVETSSPSMTA